MSLTRSVFRDALLIVAVLGLVAADRIQQSAKCAARLEKCVPSHRQQVCGSDNTTYPNRCLLLQAQCAGTPVVVKHRGKCKEVQPCWSDLSLSQRLSRPSNTGRPFFTPVCLPDGTYAPVQCHSESAYCWCVKPSGQPIPNTSVQYKKPICLRKGKSGTRRRSSIHGKQKIKDCGRMDRTSFNNNLITIFKNEYSRLPPLLASGVDLSKGSVLDRAVLEWKFTSIDVNTDNVLEKEEYRALQRLVRKVVKPKRCSRTFTAMCDLDLDERISREEWAACLGHDFNLSFRLFLSLSSASSQGRAVSHGKNAFDVLQSSVTSLSSHLPVFTKDPVEKKSEPEAIADCSSDRRGVLDEQKTGNGELYVPECKEDGRYNQIQCYKSTGYCWCVHEDNGKPIPGTSVKDQDPKCDSIASPSRPMNGCPEPKKQEFLTELMDFLMKKMVASNNRTSAPERLPIRSESEAMWNPSAEEHIAKWNFLALDKNKNKVLERKEWKSLRVLVAANRQLRRCGKRLPRYCDVNHDRKISMTEWLNCLNPQRTSSPPRATTAPSRRRGLNPLEIYLNGDD